MRRLLDLARDRAGECLSVDALASDHLAAIDRKIADLTALRRELSGLLASCEGGTVAACRVIGALAPRR